MQAARSSIKRARSPAVPSSRSSSMASHDDPFIDQLDASTTATDDGEQQVLLAAMPAFLLQKPTALQSKFLRLQALEADRLQAGEEDGSLTFEWARLEHNSARDRYTNVHPWANKRIKLRVNPAKDDYINASPVMLSKTPPKNVAESASLDRYICMQGPKRETVDHVWHMIWHETAADSPAVIIMLTPTHAMIPVQHGRLFEKCFQYYPDDPTSPPLKINEHNSLDEGFRATVRSVSKSILPNTTIELREMKMAIEGEEQEKTIYHFLYPDWPDFGAVSVEEVDSIMTLMTESRAKNGKSENARIIHCSAGIGRTGTFVALEHLVSELRAGIWEGWDAEHGPDKDPIFDTVNNLRMMRQTMVQSSEQYLFLYEVLRQFWSEKYSIVKVTPEEQSSQPATRSDRAKERGEPVAKAAKF